MWNPGGCGGALPGSDLLTPIHVPMETQPAGPPTVVLFPSNTPTPTVTLTP